MIAVVVLAAGGFLLYELRSVGNGVRGGGPPDPVTSERAHYVDIMLSNAYASGPLTEGAFVSVISGYGGGYVTSTSRSGAMGTPSEKLTLNVVLGGGAVRDHMQGETDFSPSGIACYTYTVGYYNYTAQGTRVACPESLTEASAQSTAQRQIATQVDAHSYERSLTTVPGSLADAEAAIGLSPTAAAGLDASDFAADPDRAALAVPQPSGSCVYVDFRKITSTTAGGGTTRVRSGIEAKAWAAPTQASCDGADALSAAAFLTHDSGAGG